MLGAAALLAAVVFARARNGALSAGAGVLLLTLAMLATVAALLHLLARVLTP